MTDHALLSVDEMYQADRGAVTAGVDSLTLMENAARAVVSAIRARWSPRPVAVLCGPGNNGGDGFAIARLLQANGWPVRLALLGDPGRLSGDAATNQARWTGPTAALNTDILDGAGLVIDALFGAGLSRPVEGVAADVLRGVAVPCIAVDIPSGIDGNTGAVKGTSTRAALTVTFCRAKPGHWLMPGAELRGDLIVADIGVPDDVIIEISP